jgi:multiple antibiotic resistance protein
VPLATPLITGPGVITTIILLVQSVGLWLTLLASLLNLFITWIVLRSSDRFYKFLGRQGAEVMSRIMGLILAALAIKFIKSGWMGIV